MRKIYTGIVAPILFLFTFDLFAEDISITVESDIAAEIENADENDVLILEPGEYKLNLILEKSLDLKGRDTTNTILIAIDNDEPVLSINGASQVNINNLTFRDNHLAIKVFDADEPININMTNNVFQNNTTAVEVGNVSTTRFENNTFYSNENAIVGVEDERVEVYQNIFFSNDSTFSQLSTEDITYNCINSDIENITGVNNNIKEIIIFVDQESGDFHLDGDSGCIDKGKEEKDFDDSLSDLGAFGGSNDDSIPNAVTIIQAEEAGADSIAVSWEENSDYRVEGYKVYYSTETLKGLHTDEEREDLTPVDAETALELTVTGLDFSAVIPTAPVLTTITPRDEKLLVNWASSDNANSYTLYYQVEGENVQSTSLGDVNSYTIGGLSNDKTYNVWLVAHYQKQYHFQVAAYFELSTDTNYRESSFVLDDTVVEIGEEESSSNSNVISARPEKIMAYPNLPNEGCFIATAAFGYYSAAEVQILRDFRDQYLLPTEMGAAFIDWYYIYGPIAAAFINEHESLKPVVRLLLYPLILLLELLSLNILLFIFALLFIPAFAVYFLSRKQLLVAK